MFDKSVAPRDGNVYLRQHDSATWYVEQWISEYGDYHRYHADTREQGEFRARDVAKSARTSAFLLERDGSRTKL